jgi:hypothetical protein
MIDLIRNPPKGFEEVVKLHFKLKKDIIARETQQWLDEDDNDNRKMPKTDLRGKRDMLLSLLSTL